MSQVYQAASFSLGSEVVTIVMVAASAVATQEMAARSFAGLRPHFRNSTVVLATQQLGLAPQFTGPRHVLEALRGKTLGDFRWQPIVIS
ncbi:hypothetical protein [Ferrovibrio sp.]|uniref:hypothetical protein n=1 Tax=Ferrovibrio sp. TaxID=1917215 RepID=UPI001B7053F3|nr:hypothetical protein [Ferrovibrio sp.]MBP7064434.1 hypothetical protein [Ferrovibrio sp.]